MKDFSQLNKEEITILESIKKIKRPSSADIYKNTKMSYTSIYSNLNRLIKKGVLKRKKDPKNNRRKIIYYNYKNCD